MNRRIAAILGAAAFGLGLGAVAGDEPKTPGKPGTPDQTQKPTTNQPMPSPTEPAQAPDLGTHEGHMGQKGMPSTTTSPSTTMPDSGKHLALLNVYLSQAVLNAKAIDSLVAMDLPMSEKHIREAQKNLDLSLKGAIVHVGHLKKMKDPSMTRIEELDRALKDVKVDLVQLKKAKADNIEASIDQIGAGLTSAQQIFRDTAKTVNFSILEDQSIGTTVPVRGVEEGTQPQQELDKDKTKVAPPKHDTDLLPEPARPESPPSSPTPKYR